MSRILNIRIVELITEERRSFFNYLYALTYTKENIKQISKMKIIQNKGGTILLCEKNISYNIESQLNNALYIELKRNRFLISDDQLGQVALPLDWFPSNHIVREWFPIKENKDGPQIGMILLDIHIDCRGCSPFMAPFASMKVNPTWKRPDLSENSEVLPKSTIIYCLPNPPNLPPFAQHDHYQQGYYYPHSYHIPPIQQLTPLPYQLDNQQAYQISQQSNPQMIPQSDQITCQIPQSQMIAYGPYQLMQPNQQQNQSPTNDYQGVRQQEQLCMHNQQIGCNQLQVYYPQLPSNQELNLQYENQNGNYFNHQYHNESKEDTN